MEGRDPETLWWNSCQVRNRSSGLSHAESHKGFWGEFEVSCSSEVALSHYISVKPHKLYKQDAEHFEMTGKEVL